MSLRKNKFVIFILLCCFTLVTQANLISSEAEQIQIFVGSGQNQILVPIPENIIDGNFQFTASVSDLDLLEVIDIDHTSGQTFVLLTIEDKEIPGVITITINAEFEDVVETFSQLVEIRPYHNPGLIFQIHDIVFWQEAIPINSNPIYERTILSSEGPYKELNFNEIPLTVNMDCGDSPPCTGNDFYTSLYKGYIIPPVSGAYVFYMLSENTHSFWLSSNDNFANAQKLIARSTKHGSAGTEIESKMTKSQSVQLEAGNVYAFYATQWIVHSGIGGILWEGPGMSRDYISSDYIMPLYDKIKPSAPENLQLKLRTTNSFFVDWDSSNDNTGISGYNLYIDGNKVNDTLIKDTSFKIEGLTENTVYYAVVSAIDRMGNESFFSNILEVKTHIADNQPPFPPQTIEVVLATGLSLQLQWSGASDADTEVVGYNLYVGDILYNTVDLIYEENVIVYNLHPETEYSITIEAVDAGMNISEKSEAVLVSTEVFNALGPNLGERVGKIKVYNNNTSWNEGIGLNGPYENGDMVNNSTIRALVKNFKAGAIRWGAISANSKSFLGSIGSGKSNTYGRMMNLANEIDARFALTVGVQDGIDYRTDPNTFLNLLEYLAGDASTTWGAVRASEGYTESLLDRGKGIILEIGNEVWGGAAHNAEIGSDYDAYARWAREMSEVVKTSPYYDPDKIIIAFSGRNPNPNSSYGINTKVLTNDRGHADCLAVSGYLGGNLNYDPEIPRGKTELDYYKNSIDMVRSNIEGFELTMKEMLSLTGTLKTFYLYESNMTTTSYNGRFGQAVVMADYLVNSLNYGSILPTIFHLTGGEWRITQPSDNYKELPLYTLGKYFNKFGKGHILQTDFISNNKITTPNGKTINYDAVGTFAFNDGEQFSIFMFNRDFENDFTIQIELPEEISFSENATIYSIWNEDYNSFESNIDSVTVSLSKDLLVTVPKFGMVVLSFTGENPEFEQLPLGFYNRKKPESLEVFSTRDYIIDTNRGTDVISSEVLPSDAFSSVAILDIIENTTESILTPLSGGRLHIKASGKCGDEGQIKIHVYAADNHDLNETVTVYVTNQGTDCPSTNVSYLEQNNFSPLFYPNPATDKITLNKNLDNKSILEIYDSQGRKVYIHSLTNGYIVDLKGFTQGLYIIGVLKPDGTFLTDKMLISN